MPSLWSSSPTKASEESLILAWHCWQCHIELFVDVLNWNAEPLGVLRLCCTFLAFLESIWNLNPSFILDYCYITPKIDILHQALLHSTLLMLAIMLWYHWYIACYTWKDRCYIAGVIYHVVYSTLLHNKGVIKHHCNMTHARFYIIPARCCILFLNCNMTLCDGYIAGYMWCYKTIARCDRAAIIELILWQVWWTSYIQAQQPPAPTGSLLTLSDSAVAVAGGWRCGRQQGQHHASAADLLQWQDSGVQLSSSLNQPLWVTCALLD